MKFLQIWCGENIPEGYKRCMRTVVSKVTDNDSYEIVISESFKDELFLDNLLKDVKNSNVHKIDDSGYQVIGTARSFTNIIRMEYARNFKDLFYLDCDVELKHRPNFDEMSKETNKPMVGQWNSCPDIFMFYVNSATSFFDQLLIEATEDKLRVNSFFSKLQKRLHEVAIIPDCYYNHHNAGLKQLEVF